MIKLQNVTKKFDDFIALDDFSLQVEKGSAYGLLGSNGAGKSTILRLLSGIYLQDSGDVTIEGEKIFDNVDKKQKVFFVNDETVQYNNLTLLQLKNFYKTFYYTFCDDMFNRLWSILKLPMDKKLSGFSKGMKRQAVIICALACQPKYLFLDEAFDGLDPTMRIIVKKMIIDAMLDNEMTVIISSHNFVEMEEFCDTVGLLHKGKLVFNRELDSVKGNIHKVQTSFDNEYTKEDFPDLDILQMESKGSIVYMIIRGEVSEIEGALKSYSPRFCDIVPLSLEEIFIYEMGVLGYDYTGIDK